MSKADAGGPAQFDEQVAEMRDALRRIDLMIARLSGSTLVDHFYDEAVEGLSTRMRRVALELGFHRI